MSTNSLPADIRKQLRQEIERKNLTEMLLTAVDEEYSRFDQNLKLLRMNAASSEDVQKKAQSMQDAHRSYQEYQGHLAEILKQAETINHE